LAQALVDVAAYLGQLILRVSRPSLDPVEKLGEGFGFHAGQYSMILRGL
jgi:hypothetical protein